MSHIIVRFGASLTTFILGIALVSALKPQQAPYTPCRSITTRLDSVVAATKSRTIDENLSEDERHEKFSYGADGIKCRISFADSTWVPRKNVILKIELENTTDKDIVIPGMIVMELNREGIDRYPRWGESFSSGGWFEIRNGQPNSIFPRRSQYGYSPYYNQLERQTFRLQAGETKTFESDISRFVWNDRTSSIITNNDNFADMVPSGEYEFFIRIRSAKWIIASNQAQVRIEY